MVTQTHGDPGSPAIHRYSAAAEPLALLPTAALDEHAEAIRALSAEALEPNPFLLPEFLGPAMRALGSAQMALAMVRDGSGLAFFAPVVTGGWRAGGFPGLRLWTHPFAPLGQPLLRRRDAGQTATSIASAIRDTNACLTIPDAPLASPDIGLLRSATERLGGRVRVSAQQQRPILKATDPAGAAGFDRGLGKKRRKEMGRQLRRLGDEAAVRIDEATGAADIQAALATFMALEASGWKGRAGTALAQDAAVRVFAADSIETLAAGGHAAIDIMRSGERPIAAMIRLQAGNLAIPWKIAFDETAAACSPGAQLMAAASRRWLDDPAVARVDPVCEEGNAMLRLMWRDSEPYGTLHLDFGRTGIRSAARAALEDGHFALRSVARRAAGRITRNRRRRH